MLLEIGFIEIGFISSNWHATSHIIRSILVQKNRTMYDKTRLHICEVRQNVIKVTLYVLLNQNNVVAKAEKKQTESKDSKR